MVPVPPIESCCFLRVGRKPDSNRVPAVVILNIDHAAQLCRKDLGNPHPKSTFLSPCFLGHADVVVSAGQAQNGKLPLAV